MIPVVSAIKFRLAMGFTPGGSEIGSEISLIIYTDVKENDISLFGFANHQEREIFLLLKKVKGVGSKLALSIISSIGPSELLHNIGQGDVTGLCKIPGVGKKTAERLVVELREQVGQLVDDIVPGLSEQVEKISELKVETASGITTIAAGADAVLALERLGFSAEQGKKAVAAAVAQEKDLSPSVLKDAGELVKLALGHLS